MKSNYLQFQIEKRTRSVFQLHEVYKASCFKPHLRKNPVAKTSKELVFVLSQRKIRCVAISFFGVGGSGRRPLEYSYYSNLHLFSSYFTFCYLRPPYVYRHAEPPGSADSEGLRPHAPTLEEGSQPNVSFAPNSKREPSSKIQIKDPNSKLQPPKAKLAAKNSNRRLAPPP